jgi:ribosomal protein S4E
MPDYTNENVKREAKRILAEAIRYIDGDTVKPVTNNFDVMDMVEDSLSNMSMAPWTDIKR